MWRCTRWRAHVADRYASLAADGSPSSTPASSKRSMMVASVHEPANSSPSIRMVRFENRAMLACLPSLAQNPWSNQGAFATSTLFVCPSR